MRWNSELLESTWEKRTSQMPVSGSAQDAIRRVEQTNARTTNEALGTPDRLAGIDEHRGTSH